MLQNYYYFFNSFAAMLSCKKSIIAFVFVVFLGSTLLAQKERTNQQILWSSINISKSFEQGVSSKLNLQHRAFVDKENTYQFIANVLITKKHNDVSYGLGMMFFDFNRAVAVDREAEPFLEWRPYQNLKFGNTFGKVTFSNRFTVEERFQQYLNNGEVTSNYRFSFRFRYLISAKVDIWQADDWKLSTLVGEEIFMNFGEHIVYNTYDQNRLYLKLIYGKTRMSYSIGYCHWVLHSALGYLYDHRRSLLFGVEIKL